MPNGWDLPLSLGMRTRLSGCGEKLNDSDAGAWARCKFLALAAPTGSDEQKSSLLKIYDGWCKAYPSVLNTATINKDHLRIKDNQTVKPVLNAGLTDKLENMAELTVKERLQPSLLDRLQDDQTDQKSESREKRVLSLKQLRQSVIRDLTWLLNASNLDSVIDLDNYPDIKNSVLNYGMPDLSGRIGQSIDAKALEKLIKNIISTFEPRIIKSSLTVKVFQSEDMRANAMVFVIEGDLWAQPLPLHLFLKSHMDLETGNFKLDSTG
jgi:type VI secretion system protein ImpF